MRILDRRPQPPISVYRAHEIAPDVEVKYFQHEDGVHYVMVIEKLPPSLPMMSSLMTLIKRELGVKAKLQPAGWLTDLLLAVDENVAKDKRA